MNKKKFEVVRSEGVAFVFKFEPGTDVLHIYARHLKEPGDAIKVWCEGKHTWNDTHQRFEASFEGTGIYWYWLKEKPEVVMIISCFSL